MEKDRTDVKLTFPVEVYKETDDLYSEKLKVVDWAWHDGVLRIYVQEETSE